MNNKGFSLIELIVVIILIAILAVSVAPKFDGTSSYEAHTHRAQLIAALRLTQQRAMQQTNMDTTALAGTANFCHQIVFDVINEGGEDVSVYGVPDRRDCTKKIFPTPIKDWQPDATGHKVDSRYKISFDVNGLANKAIGFDWMGRPIYDCAGGCEINVIRSGEEYLSITIEPEGYIHVFDLP